MAARILVFVSLCLGVGCGRSSLATIPLDRGGAETASTGVGTGSGSGSAGGQPCADPNPENIVALSAVRTATLFGRMLHVEGIVDGDDGYAIIDLSQVPARLVALRPDLLSGGARWIHATGAYYARLVGSKVEMLDASDPGDPVLVSSTPLGGEAMGGFAGVLASDGAALFLCLWSDFEQGNFLNRLDLSKPTSPGAPVRIETYPFDLFGDRAVANGSFWLTWAGGSVALYDLTAGKSINNHSFATDGVHHYGELTRLETDGTVAATTMVNPSYAFLYYAHNPNFVVYSSFGGGEKALLKVVDGEAFLAVPRAGERAVVGFDVQNQPGSEQPAALTETDVVLAESSAPLESYRGLTEDQGALIVSDGQELYDVPLGGKTTVQPLVVVSYSEGECP